MLCTGPISAAGGASLRQEHVTEPWGQPVVRPGNDGLGCSNRLVHGQASARCQFCGELVLPECGCEGGECPLAHGQISRKHACVDGYAETLRGTEQPCTHLRAFG